MFITTDDSSQMASVEIQPDHKILKLVFLFLFGTALSGCSSLFFYPDQNRLYFPPEKTGYSPESVFFTDETGRKIHGWWLASRKAKAKANVLFFHGNAENLTSHYMQLAWLTDSGFNLFIFDYPGYGMSEGKPTPQSAVESGRGAYEWIQKKSNLPLIVYGQSLGGIIALRTTLEMRKTSAPPDLLVADSTFSSYQRIGRKKLSLSWITWIFQPLAYLFLSDHYAPKDFQSLAPVPTLVIHGQEDRVVEPEHGEKLFQQLPEPKTFWRIPGGVHTDVFFAHDRKYRQDFLNFVSALIDHPINESPRSIIER